MADQVARFCRVCGWDWHGLRWPDHMNVTLGLSSSMAAPGCPGAFATPEQITDFGESFGAAYIRHPCRR